MVESLFFQKVGRYAFFHRGNSTDPVRRIHQFYRIATQWPVSMLAAPWIVSATSLITIPLNTAGKVIPGLDCSRTQVNRYYEGVYWEKMIFKTKQ
jgi:hypothetical protein